MLSIKSTILSFGTLILHCCLGPAGREIGMETGYKMRMPSSILMRSHPTLRNPLLYVHVYAFLHIKEKSFRKTLWKKVKLLKMSNFTFFHYVNYAICT